MNAAVAPAPLAGICFDALGTLFDVEPLLDEIDERLVPGAADSFLTRFIPWTWLANSAERHQPLEEIARTALRATAAEQAVRVDTATVDELVSRLQRLPLTEGGEDVLRELAPAQLAVLSNSSPAGLRALVDNAGVAQRLVHLLSADQVGRYKPAPQVYALASIAFGVSSDRVLMVSAHDWDIAGARLAGMRTAWISYGRQQGPALGIAPDIVVDTFSRLPDVLAQHGLIDFEPGGTTIPGRPLPPGSMYSGQDQISADSFPASDPPAW